MKRILVISVSFVCFGLFLCAETASDSARTDYYDVLVERVNLVVRIMIFGVMAVIACLAYFWSKSFVEKNKLSNLRSDIETFEAEILLWEKKIDELESLISEQDKERVGLGAMTKIYGAYLSRVNDLLKDWQRRASSGANVGSQTSFDKGLLAVFDDTYFEYTEKAVNAAYDDIISELRSLDIISNPIDYHLILLLIGGLGSGAIGLICNISKSNYYTRKSRLRKLILASDWSRAKELDALLSL